MIHEPDTEHLGRLALAAARAGAAAIHHVTGSGPLDVHAKTGPADLVTAADHAAEAAILQAIRKERPRDAVLAEESGEWPGDTGVRWVVDPLDGTTNYVYQRPDYAVSVAAEQNSSGIAGAILRPADGEWLAAWNGVLIHSAGTLPATRRAATGLAEALIGFDLPGPSTHRERVHAFLRQLAPQVRDYRRTGSTACELLSVACGRQDAYLGFGDQPWDLAAGAILVHSADGRVEQLCTRTGIEATIAGTPAIVESLIPLVVAI